MKTKMHPLKMVHNSFLRFLQNLHTDANDPQFLTRPFYRWYGSSMDFDALIFCNSEIHYLVHLCWLLDWLFVKPIDQYWSWQMNLNGWSDDLFKKWLNSRIVLKKHPCWKRIGPGTLSIVFIVSSQINVTFIFDFGGLASF